MQALNNVDTDKKAENVLKQEISKKSHEILELKDKMRDMAEEMKSLQDIVDAKKGGNPFSKAGGSDDEDNKDRIYHRNSIDNQVRFRGILSP